MDSELDSNNKFKVKSDREFVTGIGAELRLRIGQAFILEKEFHPPSLENNDFVIRVYFKLRNNNQASQVANIAKGIWSMFHVIPSEVKGFDMQGINFKTITEDNRVIAEVSVTKDAYDSIIGNRYSPMGSIYEAFTELKEKHNLPLGHLTGKGSISFNPIDLLDRDWNTIFETFFDANVECTAEDWILCALKPIFKDLKRQCDYHSDEDIIKARLVGPVVSYLQTNVIDTNTVDINYTYDREYLKQTIIDYNNSISNENFDFPRRDIERVQEEFMKDDSKKEMVADLMKGFFGGYIKVLEFVDLNDIELGIWNNTNAYNLNFRLQVARVNEFYDQHIAPLGKK